MLNKIGDTKLSIDGKPIYLGEYFNRIEMISSLLAEEVFNQHPYTELNCLIPFDSEDFDKTAFAKITVEWFN